MLDKKLLEQTLQLGFCHINQGKSYQTLEIIHFTQFYMKGTKMYKLATVNMSVRQWIKLTVQV